MSDKVDPPVSGIKCSLEPVPSCFQSKSQKLQFRKQIFQLKGSKVEKEKFSRSWENPRAQKVLSHCPGLGIYACCASPLHDPRQAASTYPPIPSHSKLLSPYHHQCVLASHSLPRPGYYQVGWYYSCTHITAWSYCMQRCISLNEVVGLFTSSDMNGILSNDCPLACVILTAANTVC